MNGIFKTSLLACLVCATNVCAASQQVLPAGWTVDTTVGNHRKTGTPYFLVKQSDGTWRATSSADVKEEGVERLIVDHHAKVIRLDAPVIEPTGKTPDGWNGTRVGCSRGVMNRIPKRSEGGYSVCHSEFGKVSTNGKLIAAGAFSTLVLGTSVWGIEVDTDKLASAAAQANLIDATAPGPTQMLINAVAQTGARKSLADDEIRRLAWQAMDRGADVNAVSCPAQTGEGRVPCTSNERRAEPLLWTLVRSSFHEISLELARELVRRGARLEGYRPTEANAGLHGFAGLTRFPREALTYDLAAVAVEAGYRIQPQDLDDWVAAEQRLGRGSLAIQRLEKLPKELTMGRLADLRLQIERLEALRRDTERQAQEAKRLAQEAELQRQRDAAARLLATASTPGTPVCLRGAAQSGSEQGEQLIVAHSEQVAGERIKILVNRIEFVPSGSTSGRRLDRSTTYGIELSPGKYVWVTPADWYVC